jgi:chloramphenicol O-acetyltransferase type A
MPWIDVHSWPRRAVFEHYRGYADPFIGLTTEIEAGPTWTWCKRTGAPFSLACWFATMTVANGLTPLRQRLRAGGVWEHEQLRIGATVLEEDETFTFVYYPYAETFDAFVRGARTKRESRRGARHLEPEVSTDDLLFCTMLPWVRFRGIRHPRQGHPDESVPRVAIGRASPQAEGVRLPVNVEAHHALVDGLHLHRFFQRLEEALGAPTETFEGLRRSH